MATNSESNAAPGNAPSGADLPAVLTSTLGSADTLASQRIATLARIHQARVAQLTRNATAVTKQYGANSQQAAAAQATVSTQQNTAARVAMMSQQLATPAPEVAANGWALHGRVFSADLQPRQRYCVFLVDANNTWQSTLGFSYTDSTGYFVIHYAPQGEAGNQEAATNEAAAPATPALFVAVVDDKAQPVQIGTTAFQPTTSMATYQNIALPAGEPPIGAPPAEIRKAAEPGG